MGADLAIVATIIATYATIPAAYYTTKAWRWRRAHQQFLYHRELAEIDAWLNQIRRLT